MKPLNQSLPDGLLLAFVGDDFTGSAASMEVMTFAGLPTVLFLAPPTPEQAARFDGMRGIGLAGTMRSQRREWMQHKLPELFRWLRDTGAPVCHYKICSTFDSSPEIGSIGCAADIAASVFDGWMPVMPAAPPIRRYQAFGNLFAAGPGGVARLDRHPVMSCHPATPMQEADIRAVLATQTRADVGLISLEDLTDDAAANAAWQREWSQGRKLMAVDTVSVDDLAMVGGLLWRMSGDGMMAIGSQGVEYALVAHWQRMGLLGPAPSARSAGVADQIIVVSGSASAVTAAQIDHAATHGFTTLALDAANCLRDRTAIGGTLTAALDALSAGRSVLIHSIKGPGDPSFAAFRAAAEQRGLTIDAANNELGEMLGQILAELLDQTGLKRAAISGGDTSSHATKQLGIYALTALAPTIPGAALCQAHSEQTGRQGLELALKGGQMGSPDYFDWIRRGGGSLR